MTRYITVALLLALSSTGFTAEKPWRVIAFWDRHIWSIKVYEDGSAAILVGSDDYLKAEAGTFQIAEIQKKWSPFIVDSRNTDGGELDVVIKQGDAQNPESHRAYLTKVQLARDLLKEAIQKGKVPRKLDVERFNLFLQKNPPLGISGLQLRADQYATDRNLHPFGPDQEIPKPPAEMPERKGKRDEKKTAPQSAENPSRSPAANSPRQSQTSPSAEQDRGTVKWMWIIPFLLLLLAAFGFQLFRRRANSGER